MEITDHMLAMKMIDKAHARGGRVQSFVCFCGGLPAPTAANNPLGYKFRFSAALIFYPKIDETRMVPIHAMTAFWSLDLLAGDCNTLVNYTTIYSCRPCWERNYLLCL
jgi:hypothetical protein